MARLLAQLERANILIGRAVAWLTLVMVVVTFTVVVLRYLFDIGWIWLQESVTWMHAAVFMLGAGYTLARDEHVRVDVFYREASPRRRAATDLLGTLLCLIPVALFLAWSSLDYVAASWDIGESSREAGGLPFPVVPLVKSLIPVTALLLLVQAVVLGLRSLATLLGRPPA
ncbi:MAG: TRAP transporter small permease subunit [Chromatiales bacterium]|nr:MAG: TRAP transporter small permease subunit [Chromatiales bacterium]